MFVFQVPRWAFAAKEAVAAPNESATAIAIIREFFMPAIPAEPAWPVNPNSMAAKRLRETPGVSLPRHAECL